MNEAMAKNRSTWYPHIKNSPTSCPFNDFDFISHFHQRKSAAAMTSVQTTVNDARLAVSGAIIWWYPHYNPIYPPSDEFL